ncbi:MAG: LacI family transcriptional regulator [Bifidobacteriaceae bacterium]|jgi:LacI family transcriptional regulator|nr:LacI family transcriptional regulator [Bifidobacteriaceae bacterium]
MPRMVDVAQRAGVSTATVSRVLNGKAVRQDLTEAVQRAVEDLEYSPDRTARSLRRRHSAVVALILPDVENPFFTSVARGVEDVAAQAGYSVVLCNSDELPEKERRYLGVAESENMAGVIIAPTGSKPRLEGLLERGRALVVLDREVRQPVDQVAFDNRSLGRKATQLLIDQGYRLIACVTGPTKVSTAVERAKGWRDAMTAAGLDAPNDYLLRRSFRVDGGLVAVDELLELPQPPQAVLATNNLSAVGVLRAVAQRNVQGKLGVAVIGDLPFATAPLENVVIVPLNPRGMGVTAAKMLVERIDGLDLPPRKVVFGVG